jgi:HSP20 family protein
MAQSGKVPAKTDKPSAPMLHGWRPFENLRREIDRLFEDFDGGFWRSPLSRSFFDVAPGNGGWDAMPAVDVAETDKAYDIKAELPGMDEKNIEVKFANGLLTIKGEKQADKEEKNKDYYRRERSFGAFERTFQVPDEVDADNIAASFKNGVLTITLPKRADAQKAAKKIEVKAA